MLERAGVDELSRISNDVAALRSKVASELTGGRFGDIAFYLS